MIVSFIDVSVQDVNILEPLAAAPVLIAQGVDVACAWSIGRDDMLRTAMQARLASRLGLPSAYDLRAVEGAPYAEWYNERHAIIAASDVCVFALAAADSAELVSLVSLARAYGAKTLLVSAGKAAPLVLVELAYAIAPARSIDQLLQSMLPPPPP